MVPGIHGPNVTMTQHCKVQWTLAFVTCTKDKVQYTVNAWTLTYTTPPLTLVPFYACGSVCTKIQYSILHLSCYYYTTFHSIPFHPVPDQNETGGEGFTHRFSRWSWDCQQPGQEFWYSWTHTGTGSCSTSYPETHNLLLYRGWYTHPPFLQAPTSPSITIYIGTSPGLHGCKHSAGPTDTSHKVSTLVSTFPDQCLHQYIQYSTV